MPRKRITLLLKSQKEVNFLITLLTQVHCLSPCADSTSNNSWKVFLTAMIKESPIETWNQKTCCWMSSSTLKLQTLVFQSVLKIMIKMIKGQPYWEHHSIWLQNNTRRKNISVHQLISLLLELSFLCAELLIHLLERQQLKMHITSLSAVNDLTYSGKLWAKIKNRTSFLKTSRISSKKCSMLIKKINQESICKVSKTMLGLQIQRFHLKRNSSKNLNRE